MTEDEAVMYKSIFGMDINPSFCFLHSSPLIVSLSNSSHFDSSIYIIYRTSKKHLRIVSETQYSSQTLHGDLRITLAAATNLRPQLPRIDVPPRYERQQKERQLLGAPTIAEGDVGRVERGRSFGSRGNRIASVQYFFHV